MQDILIISIRIYKVPVFLISLTILSISTFATGSKWCFQISGILHFMDEMEMKMISEVMEWNELFIQLKKHHELLKYNSIHHSQVVKGGIFHSYDLTGIKHKPCNV